MNSRKDTSNNQSAAPDPGEQNRRYPDIYDMADILKEIADKVSAKYNLTSQQQELLY